jgi:hypothetical protein
MKSIRFIFILLLFSAGRALFSDQPDSNVQKKFAGSNQGLVIYSNLVTAFWQSYNLGLGYQFSNWLYPNFRASYSKIKSDDPIEGYLTFAGIRNKFVFYEKDLESRGQFMLITGIDYFNVSSQGGGITESIKGFRPVLMLGLNIIAQSGFTVMLELGADYMDNTYAPEKPRFAYAQLGRIGFAVEGGFGWRF